LKIFLLLFLLTSIILSEELELDNLLKEYAGAEELHHKTKKESAGHIIVFSRSDLDQMQAYTLNDVLKTLRLFTLQVKKNGMTTITKGGSSQLSSHPIKIYINSHELNSATLGDALSQYGKMNLYFIDHIEIYQAGNSVTFGNEPASMIIKLYTKEPSRENATSTQISADSQGSLTLQAIDARVFGEYSYLANIDLVQNNYKDYSNNNSEISRDGKRGQLYFKFSKNDSYDIEVGASSGRYDILNGLGTSITDGDIYTQNIYIQATKHLDDNLKIRLSTSHEALELYNKDSDGFRLTDGSFTNQLDAKISTNIYSAMIDKKFISTNNDLSIGVQFKHQTFSINEFKSDGVDKSVNWGPKKLTIYMAYLENLYNINENHLIAFSTKVDYYKNEFSKSSANHILRLGYVALLNDEWKFKLFAMDSYSYPTFLQTTFSSNYGINPDLESSQILTLSAEIIYNTDKTSFTIGGGNNKVKDPIVFNITQNKYVNSDIKSSFDLFYINAKYKFDINNKLSLECFQLVQDDYFSPEKGASLQLFNSIKNFDFYNELLYRSSYTSIDGIDIPAGYNYSLGAIYKATKKMQIKLKGENIFDKASSVPINGMQIQAVDRRIILTMEYTF